MSTNYLDSKSSPWMGICPCSVNFRSKDSFLPSQTPRAYFSGGAVKCTCFQSQIDWSFMNFYVISCENDATITSPFNFFSGPHVSNRLPASGHSPNHKESLPKFGPWFRAYCNFMIRRLSQRSFELLQIRFGARKKDKIMNE